MGNWKKILTSNIVRAKDLVSNNIDPEGGTILRSMNGDLEWVNQDFFGNATYNGIGGDITTNREYHISSVNPYGNIIDPTVLALGMRTTTTTADMFRLRNEAGHFITSNYGLKGNDDYANWDFELKQGFIIPGMAGQDWLDFTGLDTVGEGIFNRGFYADSLCDLIHNNISLRRSGIHDNQANGINPISGTFYNGARIVGFLDTNLSNPESNSLVTITTNKRLMSLSFNGSYSGQLISGVPPEESLDTNIWVRPFVMPVVTPLIPLGEGGDTYWKTHAHNSSDADADGEMDNNGVPLYSIINAAGKEAIFYPDGLDFAPSDTTFGGGGWTNADILNQGLDLASTFPNLTNGTVDIDINKEGLNFEILCPEGYFRNIYLIMGIRTLALERFTLEGTYLDMNVWDFRRQVDLTEESVPTGNIVISSSSTGNWGDNTFAGN